MDLIIQFFILFTGFVFTSHGLQDDSQTTPDPSVFEMPTPPEYMTFFPMKGEEQKPVKFHFWSSNIGDEDIMKFPDWFQFTNANPEADIEIDKNAEEAKPEEKKNPDINKIEWQEEHNMFTYFGAPTEHKFDDRSVFSPYYNVYLSNAFPSWMSMQGFNRPINEKKDNKEEKLEIKDSTVPPEPEKTDGDLLVPAQPLKVEDKENDDINVKKISKLSNPDYDTLKISKNEKYDADIIVDPHAATLLKVNEDSKPEVKDVKSVDNEPKLNPGGITVPIHVLMGEVNKPQDLHKLGNIWLMPASIDPKPDENNNKARLTPLESSAEILKSVEEREVGTDGHLNSKSADKENNEQWKDLLYNLLQNAKPMFASMSSSKTPSSSNAPQIPAMLVPLKENPKPQGKSIIFNDNAVINNVDKPIIDQNMQESLTNPPINTPLTNPPQNHPNNLQKNQGNKPIAVLQASLPNNNQGNVPANPSVNYPPNNINQNYNYLPNSGQPILLTYPYNSNSVPLNSGSMNMPQGNGQIMQLNQVPQYNGYNNMPLPTGSNVGQNVYAIVPLTYSGGVGNMNTAPYTNINGNTLVGNSAGNPYTNSQANPNPYQVVGSLPIYNLVPINNVLLNTKDEEDA